MACRPGGSLNRCGLFDASLNIEKDLLELPFIAACREVLPHGWLALSSPISGKGGVDDMV
jgi:hypothetical protein